ncbi:hypothetical protein Tco_1222763, partial [Tanacetum coccineum]
MGGMISSTSSHLGSIPVPKYTLYPFSEVPEKTWYGYITKRTETRPKRTKPSTRMERVRKTKAEDIFIINMPTQDLSDTPDNHLAMLAILQALIDGLDMERDQGCFNIDLESRARIDESRTLFKGLEASHPHYK